MGEKARNRTLVLILSCKLIAASASQVDGWVNKVCPPLAAPARDLIIIFTYLYKIHWYRLFVFRIIPRYLVYRFRDIFQN